MSDDLFTDFDDGTHESYEGDAFEGEPSEVRLLVEKIGQDIYEVILRASTSLEQYVVDNLRAGAEVTPNRLVRLDYKTGFVTIFPQYTGYREKLYQQKYSELAEIQLPFDTSITPPQSHDDVIEILKLLPAAFQSDPRYGLGFVREMWPILYAIEEMPGVKRLIISDAETEFKSGTYHFNGKEFGQLANGINQITRKYQQDSRRERGRLAHNYILNQLDPVKYPLKEQPYEAGMIFKLLGGSKAGETKLRGRQDRQALLSAVNANATAIAKRDPKEFVQLQKDIEVVSLDVLIASFEQRLHRNTNETEWQKLLEINPFILTMLFGQPIVKLQSGAHVGGQSIVGVGEKIADFLLKNTRTHNAALVELKRPKTPLFGKEYRTNVFSPSAEIAGSIVQILDQRLKFVTSIPNIKHTNKIHELEAYAVECVIVAGRTPTDPHKAASFELIRNQIKDVRIITFDELLERLLILRELLSGERYVSELPDKEDEGDRDQMEDNTPFSVPADDIEQMLG